MADAAELAHMARAPHPHPARRVTQLDSIRSNTSLTGAVARMLDDLPDLDPDRLLGFLRPAIESLKALLLRLVPFLPLIRHLALDTDGPDASAIPLSFGQQLLGLSFVPADAVGASKTGPATLPSPGRRRLLQFLVLHALVPWAAEHAETLLTQLSLAAEADNVAAGPAGQLPKPTGSLIQVALQAVRITMRLTQLAQLVNFLGFLFGGRYPTLSSRITGLQLYPAGERAFGPPSAAEGSFPWMHRDILWDAVGTFAFFAGPYIPPMVDLAAGLGRHAGRALAAGARALLAPDEKPAAKAAPVAGVPPDAPFECAFCRAPEAAVAVAIAPCGHRACYTCVGGAHAARGIPLRFDTGSGPQGDPAMSTFVLPMPPAGRTPPLVAEPLVGEVAAPAPDPGPQSVLEVVSGLALFPLECPRCATAIQAVALWP
ncbi:hypothetical protein H696_04298 [Fonticula alba]|uniref:Pex N-terminal domain-containing protein n=1 Tax=Fonticula alba TaxID=691883 RepID=A0A058Z3P2_FONAL|nr:hypothetical protein H696_04298 [Fonticula alba]KCV68880.1 hypothetical protein H696_04298 [Fonticula alba]|eukprot:XP_009496451.1 hypothetical protein H696_04298 [Fonticula alba]